MPVLAPKHLGTYMAQGEVLHVETRATMLYYFPGPIVVLLIMLFVDYSAFAGWRGWPATPWLSSEFAKISNGSVAYQTYAMDILGLITAIVFIWLFVQYVRWIRTLYAVSNHRVIIKRGIASRDVDDIPMNQVRGVDVHQTIAQRILGYGTIRISAETGTSRAIGNEEWKGIPKPFQVQRIIETVMQNPSQPAYPYPAQPTVVYAPPSQYQQPPPSQPPK